MTKITKKDVLFLVFKVGDSSVVNVCMYRKVGSNDLLIDNQFCYESNVKSVKQKLFNLYERELKNGTIRKVQS